jgi:hypothetical protein
MTSGGLVPQRCPPPARQSTLHAPTQLAPARFEVTVYEVLVPDQRVGHLDAQALETKAVYKGKGFRNNTASYDKVSLMYRKERIAGSEHALGTNLAPDTIYFWFIKPTGTMYWATAQHDAAIANTYENANGLFFTIRTPAQQ